MAFIWTKDLETGYELIDCEHKQLIKAFNALLEACDQGKGRQIIGDAVEFLSSYTKTHFAHEEELQAKHRFPDYIAHKNWHHDFYLDIEAIMNTMIAKGATIGLVSAANNKFSELLRHIRSEDLKLAVFIKNAENSQTRDCR